MYCRLSASKTREPCPCSMNGGVPPTAPKARTGEFTPPGMISFARWKSASDCLAMRGECGTDTLLCARGTGRSACATSSQFPSNDELQSRPDLVHRAHFDVDESHRQR